MHPGRKVKRLAFSPLSFFAEEPSRRTVFLCFLLGVIFLPVSLFGEPSVSIILSRKIIPYQTASKGIRQEMPGCVFRELAVEEGGENTEKLLSTLQKAAPELIVTVGPEATHLLKDFAFPAPRVFTMILNPEKLFTGPPPFSGVSINYPPSAVMAGLRAALPERMKVGIFYSPDLNAPLVAQYAKAGQERGLSVLSFPINSVSDLRATLQSEQFIPEVVLFIPDPMIIREKIVSYLIQECLFRKIPTVGFNAWFARSGALMAFYLDFHDIGEQTGELALRVLSGSEKSPAVQTPRQLRTILNLKIAKKFGFVVSEEVRATADQVIE